MYSVFYSRPSFPYFIMNFNIHVIIRKYLDKQFQLHFAIHFLLIEYDHFIYEFLLCCVIKIHIVCQQVQKTRGIYNVLTGQVQLLITQKL